MPATASLTSDTYGRVVGFIYIFNLIVGTGALTLPYAYQQAGWALSIIGLAVLAFMSFLTATFMIESMAAANALFHLKDRQQRKKGETHNDEVLAPDLDHNESVPFLVNSDVEPTMEHKLEDYMVINQRFEMGKMANMFYSTWGIRLFYLCIVTYLYGDLAIYAAAVAKSIREAACQKLNDTESFSEGVCWSGHSLSRKDAYRMFLTIFVASVGPFTFFKVQKTKYLQIVTTFLRWKAFVTMITLCMIAIVGGHSLQPRAANVAEVPALFGVCVYSFMCHHSLPSLLAPVKPKKGLCWMLAGDIFIIFVFYNFLALTGIFTFEHIKDVYTLNFEPTTGHSMVPVVPYFQYFLLIYPVLTLSSNFPIIAITLTNNLRNLMLREDSAWHMQQVVVPLLALLPPCIIALVVEDVEFLVNFTGSYAGAMIQYVIPTTLVCIARRKVDAQFGPGVINKFASPFRWKYWVHFVMVWTAFCIICVTAHITNKFVKA